MAKFTPGPWVANNFHSGHSEWRVETDAPGYHNNGWHIAVEIPGPDAEHNARLMAAAPELLEALTEALRELHACQAVIHLAGGFDIAYVKGAKAAIKKGNAAISKAKGKP